MYDVQALDDLVRKYVGKNLEQSNSREVEDIQAIQLTTK
jgi:hypothetical protein